MALTSLTTFGKLNKMVAEIPTVSARWSSMA
jgi:hypothetical protein